MVAGVREVLRARDPEVTRRVLAAHAAAMAPPLPPDRGEVVLSEVAAARIAVLTRVGTNPSATATAGSARGSPTTPGRPPGRSARCPHLAVDLIDPFVDNRDGWRSGVNVNIGGDL
jgi:hypothetical protein